MNIPNIISNFIKLNLTNGLSEYLYILNNIYIINDGIQNAKSGALQDPAGVAFLNNNKFIPSNAGYASKKIYDEFNLQSQETNYIKPTETDVLRDNNNNIRIQKNNIIIFHTHSPNFNNEIPNIDDLINKLIESYKSYLNKILDVNKELDENKKLNVINFVPISAGIYGGPYVSKYNNIENKELTHLDPFITLYTILRAIDELKFNINYLELNIYIFNKIIFDLMNKYINKIVLLNKLSIIKLLYNNNLNKYDDLIFFNYHDKFKDIRNITINEYMTDYITKFIEIINGYTIDNYDKITDNEKKKQIEIIKKILCYVKKNFDMKQTIKDIKDISRFKNILKKDNNYNKIFTDLNKVVKQEHYMWWGFPQQYYYDYASKDTKEYYITDNEVKLYILDDYLYDYYYKALEELNKKIDKRIIKNENTIYKYFGEIDYIKFLSNIFIYYKNCRELIYSNLLYNEIINKLNKLFDLLKIIYKYLYNNRVNNNDNIFKEHYNNMIKKYEEFINDIQ